MHGVDFPFEADLSVARQRQVLVEIAAWVRSEGSRFPEGVWSFRGQVLSHLIPIQPMAKKVIPPRSASPTKPPKCPPHLT